MNLINKDGSRITKTTTLLLVLVLFSLPSKYSPSKAEGSLYDVIDERNKSSKVESYAAFNILHTYSIADELNGKKRKTWNVEKDAISRFSDYNYEIASTVQRISVGKPKVALVVYKSCNTYHVTEIRKYLRPMKAAISCHVINEKHYDPIDFIEALHIRGITTAALILPWYLVDILLTRIVNGHIDDVTFLTIEANSLYLSSFRLDNPRVKITNLLAIESNVILKKHLKNKILDSSYCVLMQNNISPGGAGAAGAGRSIQFGNKIACTQTIENVIKIVTIEHERYVFVIPERVTFNGNCVIGIPCKVPSRPRDGRSTNWEWFCCAGLYIDIFQCLLQEFDFAFELYVVEDGKFGLLRNGTWNGMIQDVYSKKAEVALQQMTVLAQRFNVVDYTHRVYTNRIPLGIVVRNTNSEYVVINWSFIDSLNHNLLIAVSGTTILILLVIFVLENVGDKCSLGRMPRRYSIGDSLSYVNGILYQRDIGGIHPRRWPGKVVAIIFAFGMTVMVGTYTAQLTASNISIDKIKMFQGFNDKSFQNPSFKVGVQGSSSYEYFLEKEGIQVTKIVIDNWREGIESVYNRSIDAFVGQSNTLDSMISNENKYCEELLLYRENKYAEDMAFAYQKGSKIGKKISAAILRLTEKGKIREIVEKWEDAQLCKTMKRKYHRYPWQYGGGLCVILCIGIGACVLLLILEHFYMLIEKYRNQVYDVTQDQKRRVTWNVG